MSTTIALSIGLDALSLASRNLILQAAGCTVLSALSIREGVRRFVDGDFDLVLLDNSLCIQDQNRLACLIRASGSRTPIVCIATEEAKANTFADETLDGEPNQLLQTIKGVLLKASKIAPAWSSDPSRASSDAQVKLQPSAAIDKDEQVQIQNATRESSPPLAKAS